MRILIPNATGPTNTGDQAILVSLLHVLKKANPEAEIIIHSATPDLYPTGLAKEVKHHLYSWAVFANKNPIVRAMRVLRLLAYYIMPLNFWMIGDSYLENLVQDYKKTDRIIFCSGAYLRTKPGFTQTLNLGMQVLMIVYAKKFGKHIVLSPMSFGPFAYRWQERLAAKVIDGVDAIMIREIESKKILDAHTIKSPIFLNHDLALLLDPLRFPSLTGGSSEKVIGFTVREWFKPKEQTLFEKNLTTAIAGVARSRNLSVRPIVQVSAPQFNEGDLGATERMIELLKKQNVRILDTCIVNSLDQAFSIYREQEFFIGMRMHSNILSALCGVPFVAIGYEHKTSGIVSDLGVDNLCVEAEEVLSRDDLGELFSHSYDNREQITATIRTRLEIIKKNGVDTLITVLQI